jgi:chromosome segregation ATPase
VQELNQEGSQLKIEIASIKDQLESKSSELLNVQSRAETLQNDLLLKEDKINELSNKISEISEEAKSSTSKSGMLDELRQELSETSKTSQELFEKNKQLYEENKKLLEEKTQQEEVLLQSAIKFKGFQEKIEELKAEQEKQESLKEKLAKELEEKTFSLSEYKNSVNELNQERLTLFKTIEELELTKVKFEELQKSSDANSKANLDNEHLRKRLEQACEFNDAGKSNKLILGLNPFLRSRKALGSQSRKRNAQDFCFASSNSRENFRRATQSSADKVR